MIDDNKSLKKKVEDVKIIKKELSNNTLYFELQAKKPFSIVKPGQFAQILVDNNNNVFLRRPFSIHNWDESNGVLSLWIKIIGKGTNSLAQKEVGDTLNLIYPLGNGFDAENVKNVLLVGGGCGVAPLLYLAKYLNLKKVNVNVLIGVKTKSEILHKENYEKYANVFFTTEDGSLGEKGFATEHSFIKSKLKDIDKIFVCGPEIMMKKVSKIAKEQNIPCQISLENTMACGIGACLCCVVETQKDGNVCTCTDGPVFYTHELKDWI